MNSDKHPHDEDFRDDDGDVRKILGEHSVVSSDTHDSSVLLAAQAAGRDIRQRDASAASARAKWTRWSRPLAIAATLIVAFYFVFDASMIRPPELDEPVRGTGSADVVPQHRSTLDRWPTRFEWPAQAGAVSYRVTLRDANAVPVWSTASLAHNEAVVPGDVGDRLEPGLTYLWTVEVEGPATENILGPFWFQIAD